MKRFRSYIALGILAFGAASCAKKEVSQPLNTEPDLAEKIAAGQEVKGSDMIKTLERAEKDKK